jgi:conjugal transfer pilus assembly protein TraW
MQRKVITILNYCAIVLVRAFLALQLLLPFIATATDFGVAGQTFKVVEEPFLQMLKKRLDNIDIEKQQEKIQARVKDKVENPTPVKGISPATKERIFYFDPTYTLDKDAILPCGKILHRSGTKVNPLQHMDLNRRMFFIDGRNKQQITWLKEQLENPLPALPYAEAQQIEDRVILVGGSVFALKEELGEQHADKVYFDQYGELTTKFGIKASPAVLVQEGLRLKIKEVLLDD